MDGALWQGYLDVSYYWLDNSTYSSTIISIKRRICSCDLFNIITIGCTMHIQWRAGETYHIISTIHARSTRLCGACSGSPPISMATDVVDKLSYKGITSRMYVLY